MALIVLKLQRKADTHGSGIGSLRIFNLRRRRIEDCFLSYIEKFIKGLVNLSFVILFLLGGKDLVVNGN